MASFEQRPQAVMDSINMSEKKETSVSVEPVPSPLTSESIREQVVLQHWPNEPGELTVSRLYDFAMNVYDIFLCVLTLALVAKTSLCVISFHINSHQWAGLLRHPVDQGSSLTHILQSLNEQIVTAFTIIFVTVMATVTRRYALWKAQRGAYLSDLEQMCGSTSLPSTIKMIFALRKFTLSSLVLVALWSFYYLGSQASAREYVHALSGPLGPIQGAYPDDSILFDFTQSQNLSDPNDPITFINEEFKMNNRLDLGTGMDIRGFLLVPDMRVKYVIDPNNNSDVNSVTRSEEELQQWITVDADNMGATYTGLAGRRAYLLYNEFLGMQTEKPLWTYIGSEALGVLSSSGISMIGKYTFTTSFISVKCDSVQALSLDHMPLGVLETTRTSFNLSSVDDRFLNAPDSVSFDVWHKWDQNEICTNTWLSNDLDMCSGNSLIDGMDHGVLKIGCTITRPHVEIVATCPAGGCTAKASRLLPSLASNPFANTSWAMGFFDHLLKSTGPAYPVLNNDTMLQGNLLTYYFSGYLYTNQSVADMLGGYGDAIMQNFNTYFNMADLMITTTPYDNANATGYASFTMTGAAYLPQYRLIWPWIALDYLSTAILFVASIVSFWLRKHTLAPDIFGYVSSLTRDNEQFLVMAGGSSLSGLDRTRAMQKVKIKIADIGEEDGVGRVGVVHVYEGVNAQPLSKHRKYI